MYVCTDFLVSVLSVSLYMNAIYKCNVVFIVVLYCLLFTITTFTKLSTSQSLPTTAAMFSFLDNLNMTI